jgi:hypothetical protein
MCLQRMRGTDTVHLCQNYMGIHLQKNYKFAVKRNVNVSEEFLRYVATVKEQQPDDIRQPDNFSKLEKKILVCISLSNAN